MSAPENDMLYSCGQGETAETSATDVCKTQELEIRGGYLLYSSTSYCAWAVLWEGVKGICKGTDRSNEMETGKRRTMATRTGCIGLYRRARLVH